MKIGLIAMSGVRVRTPELAELGVTLPQFVNRGKVVASLPSLGLLTVAALTPHDAEVVYREIQDVRPRRHLLFFGADRRGVRVGGSLSRGRSAGRAGRFTRHAHAG